MITQQQALAENIVVSEVRRYGVMAVVFAVFMVILQLIVLIRPDDAMAIFKHRTMVLIFPLLPGSFSLYALGARYYLKRVHTAKQKISHFFQHASSGFEIGLITTQILVMASVQPNPAALLLTPLPLVYFVFIVFSILRLRPRLCVATGLHAGLQYLLLYFYFHSSDNFLSTADRFLYLPPPHIIRALIIVGTGVVAAYVAQQITTNLTHSFEKSREADRVTQMFGRYVSDSVATKLLSAGELDEEKPEATEITVLFFDIRGFTATTEKLPVEKTFAELNRFLTRAADIIGKNSGFINKLLGDGFLAVFGAPLEDKDHAAHAVEAARELGREFDAMKATGLVFQDFGIGLHTGIAMVGSLGSDARREYTVIGDTVNLASRVESLNKELETRILVTEATVASAKLLDAKKVSEITVRGRETATVIFEIPTKLS